VVPWSLPIIKVEKSRKSHDVKELRKAAANTDLSRTTIRRSLFWPVTIMLRWDTTQRRYNSLRSVKRSWNIRDRLFISEAITVKRSMTMDIFQEFLNLLGGKYFWKRKSWSFYLENEPWETEKSEQALKKDATDGKILWLHPSRVLPEHLESSADFWSCLKCIHLMVGETIFSNISEPAVFETNLWKRTIGKYKLIVFYPAK